MPDAISAVLGIAGGFFSGFLVCFTIIFICMFLLSDVANLKRALGSVLMPGEDERWLGVWERVTTSISRWAIGVVVIATIAGTTQGLTAWLLGSSYALGLGVIAGLLDMIPNIGATLAGFILVPALWAEEGLTAAIIMLVVLLVYQQVENNILTPKIQGKAVNLSGVLHHRRRHALRRAAGRPRRAHGSSARGDDPDLRPGADEGPPREGRGGPRGAGSSRGVCIAVERAEAAFDDLAANRKPRVSGASRIGAPRFELGTL